MSQADLARKTGIDQASLCRWERGKAQRHGPTARTLLTLAEALNCSVDYLLGTTEGPRGRP